MGYVERDSFRAGSHSSLRFDLEAINYKTGDATTDLSGWTKQLNGRPQGKIRMRSNNNGGTSYYHWPFEDVSKKTGIVDLEAKVEVSLHSASIHGNPVSSPIQPYEVTVSDQIQVVDHPVGNYLSGALPLVDQAAKAAVFIEQDSNPRHPQNTLQASEPELVLFLNDQPDHGVTRFYFHKDSQFYPADSMWSGSRVSVEQELIRWSIEKIQERIPSTKESNTVDLIVMPDIGKLETSSVGDVGWLGMWVFRDIPLDVEPIEAIQLTGQTAMPESFVKPQMRFLTFEEADAEPTVELIEGAMLME